MIVRYLQLRANRVTIAREGQDCPHIRPSSPLRFGGLFAYRGWLRYGTPEISAARPDHPEESGRAVQGYLSGGALMSVLPAISASREVITAQIVTLKAQHDRLPAHWVDRRQAIMDQIDKLVDDWLAANA